MNVFCSILCDVLEIFIKTNIEGKKTKYLSRSRDRDYIGKNKSICEREKYILESEKINYFKVKFKSYNTTYFETERVMERK
jgi:hypothetical protein